MSRTFNFSAGPAALPEPVLRRAQAEWIAIAEKQLSV